MWSGLTQSPAAFVGRQGREGKRHDGGVLLRLAYLTMTNTSPVAPAAMTDRDKACVPQLVIT